MSKTYKAILIDDEQSARNILSNLLTSFCPEIEVLATAPNLEEGVKLIEFYQPDLVFLDIEMPNYAGYEIVSFFNTINFEIIFVTAYDNFAIKAFELSAVDYLLKPIEIDRLKEAVSKFTQKSDIKDASLSYQVLIESLKEDQVKKIVVQVAGGQKIIEVKDIVAIEANEAYSLIHTFDDKKILYSKNLKHFETLLAQNKNFFRTHKSWLINTAFLKSYSKSNFSIELSSGLQAKLSKYKKEQFEAQLLG